MTNPFLQPYNTPHGTAPFDQIRVEHFEPAFSQGMTEEDADIDRIVHNPEPPTFENTIAALAEPDGLLSRVESVFFNLLSAETNDELDALAQKMSPILSEHSNNIMLNEALFQRVKAVYESHPQLDAEDAMLLQKTYDGFVRSGANLSAADKETFRALTMEMNQLTLQFSQNCLKAKNEYQLHITDKAQLDGLPETAIEAAALAAKERELEGWVFTLEAPSMTPFMTYSKQRDLRREMYMASNTICTSGPYDNRQIVARLVNLRRELAQLLGYKTYADYVLVHRMAEKADNVYGLLDQLLEAYRPQALQEVDAIRQKARELEGPDFELQPWDFGFYSHLLRMERYNVDAEMFRPYLPLQQVIDGVFGLATRLYGITFKANPDIPVYHSDVVAYDVFDQDGTFLAVFYADFHPRKGKRSGAWMTDFKGQWQSGGVDSRPHVSVTMNFTKPTAEKPALLTLGEVETFLHEFGHSLHGMFARTRYSGLSGTNVYWDFVELPSQIMENFVLEPEFLKTFARHYETGEPLPDELIERVIQSRNYNVAYACLRQLSFGYLDMAYYTKTEPFTDDVLEFERRAWSQTQLLDTPSETCMSVQFSHIMAGGYSAGYYSYKWAEVLDADAFSLFQKEGLFSTVVAQRFRDCILSRGGTEHPMALYERFRGGKPTIEALLRRNGIHPAP